MGAIFIFFNNQINEYVILHKNEMTNYETSSVYFSAPGNSFRMVSEKINFCIFVILLGRGVDWYIGRMEK